MKQDTLNQEIQAHRDRVEASIDMDAIIDRIQFLADHPSEMLAFEQTLIALSLIASMMGDKKTKLAALDVGVLASCIAVRPRETLAKLRK